MRWLVIPLFILLGGIGVFVLAGREHDRRLDELESAFTMLEHPPGSRQLAYESELGLLQGNGNHCDYFVGALRAGTPPITYRERNAEVLLLDGARVPDWFALPPRDRLIEAAKKQSAPAGEVLYVVALFDQTAPGNDFRCH